MNEQKLIDIETTLAFQEKTLNDLSDMVSKQWQIIEDLQKKLQQTNHKISAIENTQMIEDQSNVKPPHW
jgi:SlyX protein